MSDVVFLGDLCMLFAAAGVLVTCSLQMDYSVNVVSWRLWNVNASPVSISCLIF